MKAIAAILVFLTLLSATADEMFFYWRPVDGTGSWQSKRLTTVPNYVLSIDANGEPQFTSPTVAFPSGRVPYGTGIGMGSEAGFEYDALTNNLKIPTAVTLGGLFGLYPNGSGILTLFNDFTDEALQINLGVGGGNTAFVSSDTGIDLLDLGTIRLKAPSLDVPGIVTQGGAEISTAYAMPALAIDMSRRLNTKTLAASAAMTYANATTARQWTELEVTNTAGTAITITLSTTTYDGGAGPVVPSFEVPAAAGGANGLRRVAIEWTGTRYQLHQGGSGSAGVAALTPWVSNINAAGFNLDNAGTVTASAFAGNGAALTDLPGSEINGPIAANTFETITTARSMVRPPTNAVSNVIVTTNATTNMQADAAAETMTYSGTPPEGTRFAWVARDFVGDSLPTTYTIPSTYSQATIGNRTQFRVPEGKFVTIDVEYLNGTYSMSGETVFMDNLPDHPSPTGSYLMETHNPTTGTSGESSISEIIAGTGIKTTRTGVRRTFYVNAAAMIPRTTNGAASATVETTTNDIMFDTKDFDQTTSEGVGFWWATPPTWNGGSLTAKFHWTASAGTAAETVVWSISCRDYNDGDALDQAPGTARTVSDALLATGQVHITATTTAMTPAGDNLNGKPIYFQVTRDVATDNLAADARLLGVVIEYSESANEPSAQ